MSEPIESNVTAYDIESEFGQDDLTIIYRGRRKVDNFPVIIKVVAPQFVFDTYFVMRFKDAVTRAMGLDHPNIVKTYEVAEKDDILYVARELIEGDSLAKYLAKNGSLPVIQTIKLVTQIAAALDYAHGQGVKHGDLSDSNIFIREDQLWLTDFGLTVAMEGTSLVKKGFAGGDPAYLSPERVRGEGTSRASDLYALGVLCYKMLTGHLPFHGEAAAVLHSQIYDPPTPPQERNPAVPKAVGEVVMRMLAKGLEVRYTTGAEFVRALEVAAEGTSPLKRTGPSQRTAPIGAVPQPGAAAPVRTSRPLWQQFAFWVFILTPIMGCSLAGGFWLMNRLLSSGPFILTSPQVLEPIEVAHESPQPPVPDATALSQLPLPTSTIPPATDTPPPPPTATLIPLPNEPVVARDSPFTNLVLAQGISADSRPERVGTVFEASKDPIYLFFDYNQIEIGTPWRQVWEWDDVVLQENLDVWPEVYGSAGSAWVFFAPGDGFPPGPYKVTLEVDGRVVATANFIVQQAQP